MGTIGKEVVTVDMIPVIDLCQGRAVHARGGQRAAYRPLETAFCQHGNVDQLARFYREQFGLRSLYVADLDALQGGTPQRAIIARLSHTVDELWLDAGCTTAEQWSQLEAELRQFGGRNERLQYLLPSERLRSLDELRTGLAAIRQLGRDPRLSLDLKQGELLNRERWEGVEPLQLAQAAVEAGCHRVLLLELSRVGMSAGIGSLRVLRELREHLPQLQIAWGGGVHSSEDLEQLRGEGCQAVLLATALQNGTIAPEELR